MVYSPRLAHPKTVAGAIREFLQSDDAAFSIAHCDAWDGLTFHMQRINFAFSKTFNRECVRLRLQNPARLRLAAFDDRPDHRRVEKNGAVSHWNIHSQNLFIAIANVSADETPNIRPKPKSEP
jgi:hypothetical protein